MLEEEDQVQEEGKELKEGKEGREDGGMSSRLTSSINEIRHGFGQAAKPSPF